MNFTEIVNEVLFNLGNADDAGEILTLVQGKVNFVLAEDLHTRGLGYYDANAVFVTVASQEYVAVPTGFVDTRNVFIKQTGDVSYGKPLGLYRTDETWDLSPGYPTKFRIEYNATLAALGIHFRPIPDTVYDGKIYYYRKETAISGTQTAILSAIYGDMPIIAGATYWSAIALRRYDTANAWLVEYRKSTGAMCEWMRSRSGMEYNEPGLYGQQLDEGDTERAYD